MEFLGFSVVQGKAVLWWKVGGKEESSSGNRGMGNQRMMVQFPVVVFTVELQVDFPGAISKKYLGLPNKKFCYGIFYVCRKKVRDEICFTQRMAEWDGPERFSNLKKKCILSLRKARTTKGLWLGHYHRATSALPGFLVYSDSPSTSSIFPRIVLAEGDKDPKEPNFP